MITRRIFKERHILSVATNIKESTAAISTEIADDYVSELEVILKDDLLENAIS